MSKKKYCLGCGILLQNENITQEGYVTSLENDICQRCFCMKNYGEYQVVTKSNEEYIEILKTVGKTKNLVLHIVDLLNIDKDIHAIREYLPNKMILVLNKKDALPKSVKDEKIIELKLAMKNTNNIRLYKRYSVVLKHLQGFKNKDIAQMECLEKHTVGIYIKNYIDNGLKGLEMKYSPGKKRKLSKEQEVELVDIITTHTPEEVGFKNRCNWTIALVQEYIHKKFNIDMCHSAVYVAMNRLNLSYTRPTYVLAKSDKEKQEKFKQDFEVLKKIL